VVIRNGTGLPACTRECVVARPAGRVTIGAVGRLVPQKGFDVLIEALALLGRDDVVVRVAGGGPLRRPLLDQAVQLGVADRVEFTGVLARDDLHRFLHEADIIAAPSRWDAFPQAVCDAQALGKLVIGAAVDGILEQVDDRETGLLCPPSDAKALAAAITWTLAHPGEAARIAAAGAEKATHAYSWPDIAARTIELYEDAVTELRGGDRLPTTPARH